MIIEEMIKDDDFLSRLLYTGAGYFQNLFLLQKLTAGPITVVRKAPNFPA